jgi:hypothetical protein
MDIFVNGKRFTSASGDLTVGEIIDQIRAEPNMRQCVVAEVAVDGKTIALPEAHETFTPPAGSGARIEITMESPVDILHRSLHGGNTFLLVLQQETAAATTAFRDGRNRDGHERLATLAEKIGLFMNFVDEVLRFVETSFDGFESGWRARALFADTLDLLRKITEAQERRDDVLIADLVEYELDPKLLEWKEFFDGPAFSMEA